MRYFLENVCVLKNISKKLDGFACFSFFIPIVNNNILFKLFLHLSLICMVVFSHSSNPVWLVLSSLE